MTHQEVREVYYGNWALAMRELKLSCYTYVKWVKQNYIPMPTQIRIEIVSGGKLKADCNK